MCLDLLCCCLGPAACGLCCGGCGGKAKNSVLTRLLYLIFLVFIVIISAILLAPDVQRSLSEDAIVLCANNRSLSVRAWVVNIPAPRVANEGILDCSRIIGYLAVYRICMAVASFFFVMMLITLCVFSSSDPRSYIQNGFWGIKWLIVVGLIITFFFIPEGQDFVFSTTSLAFGLIGSIIFIIIQIILLVDLAHQFAEYLLDKVEENDNKWWYLPMVVSTIFIYFCVLLGTALMYAFFTEVGSCSLNVFFITSTVILSVAVSVIAILPWVQRVQPKSGLLQPAVVSGYCTYLTWSAISTEPYGDGFNCNIRDSRFAVFSQDNNNALAASIVGIIVLLVTVAYICFSLSANRQLRKFKGGSKDGEEGSLLCCDCVPDEKEDDNVSGENDEEEKGKWRMSSVDDEKDRVTYSYAFFHFLMLISVLFLMMQLTNWANPGSADTEHFQNSWASVWVKMATVWLCFGVYVWTLVAPLVLGNCRDFDYVDN